MLFQLLTYLSGVLFFFLHVSGAGAFPKALSAAEERKCLQELKKGNPAARQKLIEHNLRLVAHVVKKYYALSGEQDDLISIGTIGLIKAIDSFDPDKGIRLSSYASRCVENEVLMHFRALKKSAQDLSLDDPIEGDGEGSLSIMDTIACDDTILEDIDLKMKSRKLYSFLPKVLTEREKEVIVHRYGLFGTKPLPQREVAKMMGISRSYVSRIESTAVKKLREEFSRLGDTEF